MQQGVLVDQASSLSSTNMSVKDALYAYSEKQLKKNKPKRRKNKKPEREVERQVMAWLNKNGFSCHVVESKAVYSPSAGRYVRGQAVSGFTDIVGCDKNGTAVFIELKAPGRKSTIKEHQRAFITEKIRHNCFALCTDSVNFLSSSYENWIKISHLNKQVFLYSLLPKKKAQSGGRRESFDL